MFVAGCRWQVVSSWGLKKRSDEEAKKMGDGRKGDE